MNDLAKQLAIEQRDTPCGTAAARRVFPYRDAADELADHLQRLNAILASAVDRFRRRHAAAARGLNGVAIFDAEIDEFLSRSSCTQGPPEREETDEEARDTARAGRLRCELRAHASALSSIRLPIHAFRQRLRLSALELDICLLCLAAEIDSGYGRLFAYLHNDVTRATPSVGLVLQILGDDWSTRLVLREHLSDRSRLTRHGIVALSASHDGVMNDELQLDSSLLQFLLGAPIPPGIAGTSSDAPALEELIVDEAERKVLETAARSIEDPEAGNDRPLIVMVRGPEGVGRRSAATALCRKVGRAAFAFRYNPADSSATVLLRNWVRDVHVAGACPVVYTSTERDVADGAMRQTFEALLSFECPLAFVLTGPEQYPPFDVADRVDVASIDLKPPPAGIRRHAWTRFLAVEHVDCADRDLAAISAVYPFAVGTIRRAAHDTRSRGGRPAPRPTAVDLQILAAACRAQTRHRLGQLAEKLQPRHDWSDLVLPADEFQRLREIANAVRSREQVMERWAFARKVSSGPGVNALFFGPSGTGKTMAASIVARDLGMDIYRVDLSRVVSKYVGETEKNLDALFDEARRAYAVLLFDEAEALFGKRSEVKDAHDRYSNIEVAYLLQRMEAFEGVALLATNLRNNMDTAFVRRLQFAVEFPLPGFRERLEIWRHVWPASAELADDVDLPFMAETFEVAGGFIRNIALMAAYLAADDRQPISMTHLIAGTRREFQKHGRTCVDSDFGRYAHLLTRQEGRP